MNLQVLDALGIEKTFVLGTSQGGWITVRMALLRPSQIEGIIPLGTSLDYESERTRKTGCWNGPANLAPSIKQWTTSEPVSSFEPGLEFSNFLIDIGFGKECGKEVREYWNESIRRNYEGEEGRKRIRMAAINLAERDGLHGRLSDVKCPVMWMHGTKDAVYSVENAKVEIKMFVNSPSVELRVVEDGQHFLSFSHPKVSLSA
jgi:pimeloyl-ACP methyl ester carboxylesterase